ncbi:MAG: hypothetical protein OEV43_10260 [Coriobacteriia bacterium]|nr:hypothetical protein [Coriobacteriia bacterium]
MARTLPERYLWAKGVLPVENRGPLTQVLAAVGGLLVFGVALSVLTGDWRTPISLAQVAWFGGAALSYAALRARAWLKVIVTGFGLCIGALVLGLPLGGLVGGGAQARLAIAIVLVALYYAGLVVMTVGWLLLLRNLYVGRNRAVEPSTDLSESPAGVHEPPPASPDTLE